MYLPAAMFQSSPLLCAQTALLSGPRAQVIGADRGELGELFYMARAQLCHVGYPICPLGLHAKSKVLKREQFTVSLFPISVKDFYVGATQKGKIRDPQLAVLRVLM